MASINGTYTTRSRYGLDDQVADTLHGTSSGDTIWGNGGADHLYGNGGHDVIHGGHGDDWINGGTGWDTLTGDSGKDTFAFERGHSGPSYAQADVITDFSIAEDTILFHGSSPAGSKSNFVEWRLTGTGNGTAEQNYNDALATARGDIGGNVQFAFYTNGKDGYLFADLDHNGTVDTGIELRGLDSVNDFSYLNIL